MERDDEVKGSGNSYTTEFRQYDPRLGRWLSTDPLADQYPGESPYSAYSNNPIYYIDPDGRCYTKGENGEYVPCDDGEVGDTKVGAFGNDWTFGEEDGWQLTNGADPSSVTPEYSEVTPDGSADYYVDRYKEHIDKYNTRPPDYYLSYGHKYNIRFTNGLDELSLEGQKWSLQTRQELQVLMEKGLRLNPGLELNNGEFKRFAFETHVPAYSKGNTLFNLPTSDLIEIVLTPDFKDSFGSPLGLKQILEIWDKMGKYKGSQHSLEDMRPYYE